MHLQVPHWLKGEPSLLTPGLYWPSDPTGDVAVNEVIRSQAPKNSHVYHSSANYHKGISEENHQDDHLDERALVSEEGPGTKPEQLECCIDSKEEQEHHLKTGMNLQQWEESKLVDS